VVHVLQVLQTAVLHEGPAGAGMYCFAREWCKPINLVQGKQGTARHVITIIRDSGLLGTCMSSLNILADRNTCKET